MLTLSVEKRDPSGAKARALLRTGKLPGVVYGPHQKATPVVFDERAFEKIFRAAGEAGVVALSGLGAELPTLIHEIDLDPVSHRPRHVDFYAVTKGEKVEVAIPITFSGESPAVKLGANLVKVLHEIEVEADPMRLPQEVEVDISSLSEIGGRLHVRDIKLPAGVELVSDPEEVIALIQEVREEKVEEVPAPDLSAIEVEQKGKEEGDGEAEAAPPAEGSEAKA